MKINKGFTALAAVLAIAAGASPAQAQLLPIPIDLSGLLGNGGLQQGCPWVAANDTQSNNTGILDSAATYRYSTIPVNPRNGGFIRLTGRYPRARYFSLQTYDGFRPGNDIDSLPDAQILPDRGGSLSPNQADLPNSNNYTDTYTVRVVFEDRPTPPLAPAPNTLYAGTGTSTFAFNKQIVYRVYLPNPGSDRLGDQLLPVETFVGPQGERDLRNTPDTQRCNLLAFTEQFNIIFPTVGLGMPQSTLRFRAVAGRGGVNVYPNADGNFLSGLIGRLYGDLVVVRGRAASYPALPPAVTSNPDTRYYSLCEFQSLNSSTVGCVADRDTVLQPDGYFTFVISTAAKRPALANAAGGYNWLDFGGDLNGTIGIRQILPNPNFAGNLNRALAQPDVPLEQSLGVWAPTITYCDSATFAAFAASGGQAVFDNCKRVADSRILLGGARR